MDPMDYLFHQVWGDLICQMDPMHYLLHQVGGRGEGGGDMICQMHPMDFFCLTRSGCVLFVRCILWNIFCFYRLGRCVVCHICMSHVLFFVSPGWQMCGLSDMYVPCIVFRFTRLTDVWFVRYVCPMYCFSFHQIDRCVVCQICMSHVLFFVPPGRQMCGLSDMYVPCIVFCFTRSAGVPRQVPCQDGAVSLPVRHGSALHLPPPRGWRNAIFPRHSGSDT